MIKKKTESENTDKNELKFLKKWIGYRASSSVAEVVVESTESMIPTTIHDVNHSINDVISFSNFLLVNINKIYNLMKTILEKSKPHFVFEIYNLRQKVLELFFEIWHHCWCGSNVVMMWRKCESLSIMWLIVCASVEIN